MFVERDDLMAGYLIQRFGAVTLAMSTRVHCFGEFDEAEPQPPPEPRPKGPRRNLHLVPSRNVILGADEPEVDARPA
jgi:hypothetical protein